ncbi:MAG: 6-phosphofructokinase [Clostridia bacterium]|nr:6-phosphofructokinase [Clostridia bacterium]
MNILKGNAVVGQSGGPTAAINATLSGVIKGAYEAHKNGAIGTLYGMNNGILGFCEERIIDLSEIWNDKEKLSMLETTPAAALGSCRKKLPKLDAPEAEEEYAHILNLFKKYDIRYFFYIGGNDSMDTVAKLSKYTASKGYEMRIIGVPKTIDNDLAGTDHTPGFGSAAKFVATVCSEIVYDCAVYDIKAVTIVEIMGRDAGWLTTAAALPSLNGTDTPDLIYLPEHPFSLENFFNDLRELFEKKPNIVVAVSEGIRTAEGKYVTEALQSAELDVFGHKQLAGTGAFLANAVKAEFGCKTRAVELNLPQRCAAHILSAADIDESVRIGKAAVKKAVNGISGRMITVSRSNTNKMSIGSKDVQKIANAVRTVPRNYINNKGNYVTGECLRYLAPLVAGEKKLKFANGTPLFFKF